MAKIVGQNYLHPHPHLEEKLEIGEDHIIVDKKDWQEIVWFFNRFPDQVKEIGKNAGYATRQENVNINVELSPERREQLAKIIDIEN